ncbi:DgyrCDS10836 [Dimorphilus gyrociliatus]|uniref:DgyrCDS10836 n=1 Tax=Dimorphilus gyrociliatus TaxID=2664684 RepID=A0A7I8W6J1_9ANNE|nr:DgyrCDS10836 [Dimorphilus gyrociliatus]
MRKEDRSYENVDETPVLNDKIDWCDDADDWGLNDDFSKASQSKQETVINKDRDISESIQNLEISSAINVEPAKILPRYINVMEEIDKKHLMDEITLQHEKELLAKYSLADNLDIDSKNSASGSRSGCENYEKCRPEYGDKHLIKFYKYISRLPEQIIRYCYGGDAIPMQEHKANEKCTNCGGDTLYEVQLMPALVQYVEIEFGTVLIYTCSNNCYKSDYIFEYAFVQNDVDDEKLRDYENKRL